MTRRNIHTPEGLRDLLFDECFAKRNMEEKARSIFRSYGYNEIETPSLEYYEVFSPGPELISQETMFKFFDPSGRILVLRPDTTIPVARVAATKFADDSLPKRFSYIGNTFRYNEHGGGKQKEFTVAGIELMGVNTPEADAEVIAIAVDTVLALGIEEFQVDVGQMDFFRGLMEESGLEEQEIEQMRLLIDRKDFIGIEQMVESRGIRSSIRETIMGLPRLFGGVDILERVRKTIGNDKALQALDNLKRVFEILEDYQASKYVSIDLGLVHDLNYYTGIIFKGFTYDIGFPILRGGRYDNLVEKFGRSMPSTGFSVGLNMVMTALERQQAKMERPLINTFVFYDEKARKAAFDISRQLRRQGLSVEVDIEGRSAGEAAAYALARGIGGTIQITADGSINVHDLNTGEIKTTTISDILKEAP